MKMFPLMALAGLMSLVSTTPISPSRTLSLTARQSNGTSSAPCAQVSEHIYGDGSTVANAQVPAGLAFACISSVPFNASSGKNLVNAIRPYLDWQSTLEQLKNPPAEYVEKVQPPVDIIAGLDEIISNIDASRFQSEYDFGWSLYTLIQSAHDGHFSYIPDIVGQIFSWGRPVPLVSVSEDGQQLPAVFVFADVIGAQYKNISYTPSPVVEIDGMDASAWLENWSQLGSLQDRDALYNNVFYELAQVSLSGSGSGTGTFTGGGRGRYVYPGDTTTLKFANGTEYTMQNYARASVNFRNVNSGEDLARKWISYGTDGAGARVQSLDTDKTPIMQTAALDVAGGAAPGYPPAAVPGPGNLINGFFIDSPGYEDVAVLQVPNFVGSTSAEIRFQRTTQEFIPKALAAGKTKLIIDLQANGGGTILQGYDLFKQLFPDEDPYGANRFRAIEAIDMIGKAYSSVASRGPRETGGNSTVQNAQTSWFDYHTDMTVEGKSFSSWAEKFGPQEVNGVKYTTLARWNLSDIYVPFFAGGINVTGYGPLANVTGPPKFKPENIVIVTDGYCASTCAIFAELLTQQAGVKTIAMGGRTNKNQIQAIGGVKGVNNYAFAFIQTAAQTAVRFDRSLNSSILRENYYDDLPYMRAYSAGVNNRDGLRRNDTSGIALQFIYEEANCRLYYTPEMTVDITALWKAVSDAQWGNSGKCVSGGGYGQKRNIDEVTTKLGRRRVQVAQATAMRQVQALEKSFSLETQCQMKGDGFMEP
jgi:phosphotransferase system IIB component